MNLKAIIEKRNELLAQADVLVEGAEKEVRSLSDEEQTNFDSLTTQIEKLNSDIQEMESRRKDGEKIDQVEERKMEFTQKEKEFRGVEQFIRRQRDKEEVRALTTTADGGTVIPENVEGTIVLKMIETSPVFAKARKLASVSGSLKIAKENDNTVVGFVGEGTNVIEGAIAFEEVKLTQKRVGASISLSNQLINDSAVNIVDYSINLLARRAGKAIEKSSLTGQGGEEFAGIINDAELKHVDVSLAAGAVTIDNLLDMYNAIHPDFLDGSQFIFSRPFFNVVAKMKDQMGHYYMQNGVVNGKLSYTLFGAEVSVTDALGAGTAAGDVPVLFGNIEEAYAIMIKQGFALQHVVGDTTQALRGSQLLVLDAYMDGAVYNPQAMAKLNIQA